MSNLRVGIIGTGYVGLVTGVCLGELGFSILCGDVIPEKVDKINKGIPPIFENGLKETLKKLVDNKLLFATLDINRVVNDSDIIFICTGTPSRVDGSIDLKYVEGAARDIAKSLAGTDQFKTIVVKSTVVPGTTSNYIKPILEEVSGKKAGIDFGIGMNPEFLKEGVALKDFRTPDRVVIGCEDNRSYDMISSLYSSFACPIMKVSLTTAEMIKYASNTFLATKISFINEISNMSEVMGADITDVAKGMGLDSRISSKFLRPGLGFGGSCFSKDVKALKSAAEDNRVNAIMLTSLLQVNDLQPLRAKEMLERHMSIENKRIAFLGMAFKPDTDDMRESRAISLAQSLIDAGATIIAYDPIAKETAVISMPEKVVHVDSAVQALQDADAAILVTEWDEFINYTASDFSIMRGKVIIDGRRVLDYKSLEDHGYIVSVLGNPVN